MASPAGKSPKERFSNPQLAADCLAWKKAVRERSSDEKAIGDDVENLLDRGFSKRMVADLLNVNLTEVLRWLSFSASTPEERKAVDELVTFCDLLDNRFSTPDAPCWFEKGLAGGCVINMMEIYGNGHTDLVLDYAANRKTGEEVLDAYDPAWRDLPPSMWEVSEDENGEKYIHMKGDGGE